MTEKKTKDLVKHEPTPAALLAMAIKEGADLDKLEKLMELQERYEANQARKAYVVAMTEFKANPPKILKQTEVSYDTSAGQTSYKHASLDHVTEKINKALSQHGLFASWSQKQENEGITVTCKITHKEGHSEETSLTAGADTSGKKNPIQSLGSTITYLQRYTILALTGLAAKGMDTNGKLPEDDIEKANENQLADIETLQNDAGLSEKDFIKRLEKKFGVNKAEDLSETQAEELIKALDAIKNA